MALFFSSCSKNGSQGPEGTAGENGSSILTGNTDPSPSSGTNGDFYLNLQSRFLFGPKTNDNWGNGVSLSGDKGNPGSTILSGTATPTLTVGEKGDYYIDLTKMDFYGPKTEDSWGTPITLLPKKPLQKRILVKTNFGYSKNCDICKQYVPASGSSPYSIYKSSSAKEIIHPGDISEYYENGIVLYEASINNGEWIALDPNYSRPISHNFKVSNREYYTTFTPQQIAYSKSMQELTIALEREIRVPSLYSEAQLTTWLDTEMLVSIRITLLPKDTVEYLAKKYPNHKIDSDFVIRYTLLQDKK